MSGLLVSVRDATEAKDALAGGADLIDVKEPAHGSLGAATASTIREVIESVNQCRPVSVALGELADISDRDLEHCAGAQFAKVGLSGCLNSLDWVRKWRGVVSRLPQDVQPVAVVYADHATCDAPPPDDILQHADQIGCSAALVDTFDKTRGRLLHQWTTADISSFAQSVRDYGMMLVLAGSLSIEDLASLASHEADYIAVRTAVCESDRRGRLNQHLVEQFARQLNGQSAGGKCGEKLPVKFA